MPRVTSRPPTSYSYAGRNQSASTSRSSSSRSSSSASRTSSSRNSSSSHTSRSSSRQHEPGLISNRAAQRTQNSANTSKPVVRTKTSVSDGTTYGKVLYEEHRDPSISLSKGIRLADVEVGAVKIGSGNENVRWNFGVASANLRAGAEYNLPYTSGEYRNKTGAKKSGSIDYIGFSADASLLRGDVSVDIPLPLTEKELTVTLTGKAFSVGAEANYDAKKRTVTVGASALFGASVSAGIN